MKYMDSIVEKKDEIIKNFNNDCEKRKNRNIVMAKYSYLNFKIHSVCNFLCFKQGLINMTLPEGIVYPKIDDDTPDEDNKVNKPTNLKGFFRKRKK